MSPFKTKPKVGDSFDCDIYGSVTKPMLDQERRIMEDAGHVSLKAKRGKKREHFIFVVTAVSSWWDDNLPLTEPDYSI